METRITVIGGTKPFPFPLIGAETIAVHGGLNPVLPPPIEEELREAIAAAHARIGEIRGSIDAIVGSIAAIDATVQRILVRLGMAKAPGVTRRQRIKNKLIKKYGYERPNEGPAKVMQWLAQQPGFENFADKTFWRAWRELEWLLDD
jgi:hypothetical protein